MDVGVPVEAPVEHRSELPRRPDIVVAREDVRDLVGVFALHAVERELGEARGGIRGQRVRNGRGCHRDAQHEQQGFAHVPKSRASDERRATSDARASGPDTRWPVPVARLLAESGPYCYCCS